MVDFPLADPGGGAGQGIPSTPVDMRLRAMFEQSFHGATADSIRAAVAAVVTQFDVTLQLSVDAGTSTVPTGLKVPHLVTFPCRVKHWYLLTDAPADVEVDILYASFEAYRLDPAHAISMCGSAPNHLLLAASSGFSGAESTTDLSKTWAIVAVDSPAVIRFNLLVCTAHQLSIVFTLGRTE